MLLFIGVLLSQIVWEAPWRKIFNEEEKGTFSILIVTIIIEYPVVKILKRVELMVVSAKERARVCFGITPRSEWVSAFEASVIDGKNCVLLYAREKSLGCFEKGDLFKRHHFLNLLLSLRDILHREHQVQILMMVTQVLKGDGTWRRRRKRRGDTFNLTWSIRVWSVKTISAPFRSSEIAYS